MGQLLVITSGKGGTGKSAITVGVGAALAARGRKVLLIDMAAGMRCLDLMLGLSNEVLFDLGDILHNRCEPVQAIQQANTGLYFIPGPQNPEDFTDVSGIASFFSAVGKEYEYVLVDSPPGIGRGFELSLSGVTDAIVVVTPDDIALRDAAEVRRRLEAHGIQNQSMIINRFLPTLVISGVMPNVDQMIDQAGIRLLGVVPEDGVVSLSAAKGIPPAKGRAKMAFQRIASRIDGEPVPLANLKRL